MTGFPAGLPRHESTQVVPLPFESEVAGLRIRIAGFRTHLIIFLPHMFWQRDRLIDDVIDVAGPKEIIPMGMIKGRNRTGVIATIIEHQIEVARIVDPNGVVRYMRDHIVMDDGIVTTVIEVDTRGESHRAVIMHPIVPDDRIHEIGAMSVEHAKVAGQPAGMREIVELNEAFHQAVDGDQIAPGISNRVVAKENLPPGQRDGTGPFGRIISIVEIAINDAVALPLHTEDARGTTGELATVDLIVLPSNQHARHPVKVALVGMCNIFTDTLREQNIRGVVVHAHTAGAETQADDLDITDTRKIEAVLPSFGLNHSRG